MSCRPRRGAPPCLYTAEVVVLQTGTTVSFPLLILVVGAELRGHTRGVCMLAVGSGRARKDVWEVGSESPLPFVFALPESGASLGCVRDGAHAGDGGP